MTPSIFYRNRDRWLFVLILGMASTFALHCIVPIYAGDGHMRSVGLKEAVEDVLRWYRTGGPRPSEESARTIERRVQETQSDVVTNVCLGILALRGCRDLVEIDEADAVQHIALGADAGNSDAQAVMAWLKFNGLWSVPLDAEAALCLAKRAHAAGIGHGSYLLAAAHVDGVGTDADLAEALELSRAAVAHGYSPGWQVMPSIVRAAQKSGDDGSIRLQAIATLMEGAGRGDEGAQTALFWLLAMDSNHTGLLGVVDLDALKQLPTDLESPELQLEMARAILVRRMESGKEDRFTRTARNVLRNRSDQGYLAATFSYGLFTSLGIMERHDVERARDALRRGVRIGDGPSMLFWQSSMAQRFFGHRLSWEERHGLLTEGLARTPRMIPEYGHHLVVHELANPDAAGDIKTIVANMVKMSSNGCQRVRMLYGYARVAGIGTKADPTEGLTYLEAVGEDEDIAVLDREVMDRIVEIIRGRQVDGKTDLGNE